MGNFDHMKDGFFQITLNNDEEKSYSSGPRQDTQREVSTDIPVNARVAAIVEKTGKDFTVVEILRAENAVDTIASIQLKIADYLSSIES